ncbi:MAG: DMT family transporter [Arenicellales bacterium]
MNSRTTMLAHGAMLLFSALVAGSFSLGHLIANDISPAALTAMRFPLALLVIGVWVWKSGLLRRKDFEAPWRYLVLGGLMGAYFVLMFEGLKTAPAVSTAAVFTLMPIMSGVFAYFLLGQIATRRIQIALSVGAVGAVWVIFRADLSAILSLEIGRGELIYFVGCIAHALYTPLIRKLNRGQSPLVFTFGMMVGASILMLIYGASDLRATDFGSLRPLVWITLVYLAVFASAASFSCIQYSTLHLPSAKVMAYTYLTPSWVILWEAALGRPLPPVGIWIGVLVTVGALIMLLRNEDSL